MSLLGNLLRDAMSGLRVEFTCTACPVQAEGTIDGQPFYFRSRGKHWSIEIGGGPVLEFEGRGPAVGWWHRELYSDEEYAAGWITEDEALGFISRAAYMWRTAREIRM